MKKKQLQRIKELSIFIFTEKEYIRFIGNIINNKYNEARLFLDYINEKFENSLEKEEFLYDNGTSIVQYKKIDSLMDIVIELIVINGNRKYRRKQIKSITQ
jgi:hypothetical protein